MIEDLENNIYVALYFIYDIDGKHAERVNVLQSPTWSILVKCTFGHLGKNLRHRIYPGFGVLTYHLRHVDPILAELSI